MDEAFAEFLRHLALEKNASPHTVKSYREDLAQAVGFFRTRLGQQDPAPDRLTTRVLRAIFAECAAVAARGSTNSARCVDRVAGGLRGARRRRSV